MGWWRNIYDVDGERILYADVPITQSAEHTQELMSADYVQLSWVSPNYVEFPAGAIFKSDSAIYRLKEPYKPTQKDELTWEYKPQFHGLIGQLTKYPFLFVNDQNGTITREPDFEVTGTARVFMEIVQDIFERDVEDGTQMHFTYDTSITKSVYLRFENVDIISALNMIAEAFETEWYYDSWNKTWHLGKTEVFDKEDGSRILLEVGNNVGVPSVTQNNEPYFNRYYAFGSTRNIMSDTQGIGNKVNTIVDKRLTLSPTKYPNGYYDVNDFLKNGEIYATTLIFDDVYPKATEETEGSKGLAISDIITRTLNRLDENNQPIPTGEYTDLGEPKYETYTEYFFALNDANGNPKITITENDLMPDKDISCSFESGMLTGYEFVIEPIFHEKQYETVSGLNLSAKITIPAGYYRIRYIEEGGFIVPTNVFQGLYPAVGDEIALFNVKIPSEYVTIAQNELERRLQEEIARREVDNNVYQFKSNPVAFNEDNATMRLLRIGTAVTYKNGDYELVTRVTKLVTKLDYDCEKTITIGNKTAKGTISQLKEEVAGVSTNVKLLEGVADSTEQILQAYKRTQESMMQGFARIKDMWVFDEKDANTIYSKYNIYSLGYVSTKGRSSNESGAGGTDLQAVWDSLVFNNDVYANYIINSAHIPNLLSSKITDFESAVKKYASIPTNVSQLVNDAGFITASAIVNKADKATTLAGYGITDAIPYKELRETPYASSVGYGYTSAGFKTDGGIVAAVHHGGQYGFALQGENGNRGLYYRGMVAGVWNATWRTIAFTDTKVDNAKNADSLGTYSSDKYMRGFVDGTIDVNSNVFDWNRPYIWRTTSNPNTPINHAHILHVTSVGSDGAFELCGAMNQDKLLFRRGSMSSVSENATLYKNAWKEIAFTATTLAGYGITDAQKIGAKWENSNYYTLEVNSNVDNRVESLYYANGVVQFSLSIYDGILSLWNRVSNKSLQIDSRIRFSGSELQKAVYDYVNVSGTANDTAMANILAPSNYDGTTSLGGNFKFYDTKFYGSQSNTSNRCQLAYGYDVDSIHYRRCNGGVWNDWKKVAWEDEVHKIGANISAPNIHASTHLTANSVNIAECIVCNNADGIINLFGDKVVANSPIEAKSIIKIGNATLSYDYNSGMLLCDKGIASLGAISTKGTSSSASGIASAQFGLYYEDFWRMATNAELSTYGASASIDSGEYATNNGTIVIACDAFVGKTIADVDVFVVGYGEAPSALMSLVPYKIDGNKCYFRLNATQLSGFTGFKIKVY